MTFAGEGARRCGRGPKLPPIIRRVSLGQAGITLIELLLLMAYIWAFYMGAQRAWSLSAEEDFVWRVLIAGLGGLAGIVGVMIALLLLLSPFWIYLMIGRALSPADLACRCAEESKPAPAHLLPAGQAGESAMAESRLTEQIGELAFARSHAPLSLAQIPPGFSKGSGWAERLSIAAHLDFKVEELAPEPFPGPIIKYSNWSGLPSGITNALRAGLPPRLILAWGILLLERALPLFEEEFHQDTRPRQILGAAAMILRGQWDEPAELCRELAQAVWSPEYFGCRKVHRSFWSRMMDAPTPGHQSGLAAYAMAQLAFQYASPERLWLIYEPGDMRAAYETADSRITGSQPSYYAESAAGYCLRLGRDRAEETRWQKETLARLILSWERWEEDRADWRARLENEWAPMMEKTEYGKNFDKAAFILAARERLAPWENKGDKDAAVKARLTAN